MVRLTVATILSWWACFFAVAGVFGDGGLAFRVAVVAGLVALPLHAAAETVHRWWQVRDTLKFHDADYR